MKHELDMSGVAVDVMDRTSLKYVRLHLGKKDNTRILRVPMYEYLYTMLQDFLTWCRR
jgi:hypothetical protein